MVWHQASQEVTAARLRFQVAGALAPHSSASAAPISALAAAARVTCPPRSAAIFGAALMSAAVGRL
ncbi:hypothetical protein ACIBO2_03915 [Nonomuraea sp. NPDC050022]|uniref:hypothetical protein n=1 Tax=unclassified Nonomuraea TaxID=2593643 RepID=UPI0033CFDE86